MNVHVYIYMYIYIYIYIYANIEVHILIDRCTLQVESVILVCTCHLVQQTCIGGHYHDDHHHQRSKVQ